ncbi:DUF3263 domain-containing protein [Microbacterium sp. No. 7]|uniref:DUF3263 domain-containing protein n=1 Tax=Microbacterium sp. No. 7 TaxID=1714373 RepID=UPI0006CFDDC6|nr:DUF3263 domain-containing protein [Microbacterium sp. No. 7]ALJ19653.1 hypothetical protein AOA12_06920 [Microbacterium sp. No. 7]
MPLDERSRALLDFESRWTGHTARKEEAVRSELSLTPARYYQVLGRLIETADALAYDPVLVHRLRRVRDSRRRGRAAGVGNRSGAALSGTAGLPGAAG